MRAFWELKKEVSANLLIIFLEYLGSKYQYNGCELLLHILICISSASKQHWAVISDTIFVQ